MLFRVSSSFVRIGKAFVLSAAGLGVAAAQVAPDAGQIQRQIERSFPVPSPQAPAPSVSEGPMDRSGPTVTIERFVIEGATLIPSDELARSLDAYIGKPMSLGELQEAAQSLVGVYRERGWFARVLLPEQDASSGTLRIVVVEGRFGQIIDQSGETRANAEFVTRMVGKNLRAGEPYSLAQLERGLLLANDLPGIQADGVLQAGERPGTTDLAVTVTDGPRAAVLLGGNNYGSRYTGKTQGNATLGVNNLTGYGDQLTGALLMAERMDYQGAGYSLPIGANGLRARVDVNRLHYRLGKDFEDLDVKGKARSLRAGLSYPLVRATDRNIWVGVDYARRRTFDQALGTTLRERAIDTYAFSFFGDSQDTWGRGGMSRWRIEVTGGEADLRHDADRAQDAAGARIDGGFTRLSLDLQRDQLVSAGHYVRARLHAQATGDNLESSQQHSLGGPYGVRGYPQNEASGDLGAVLQLEFHSLMSWTGISNLDGFVFADAGLIRQHKRTWAGWNATGAEPNNYALYSAGMGASWRHPRGFAVEGTFAVPIGGNAGTRQSNRNQDGSRKGPQIWISVSQMF